MKFLRLILCLIVLATPMSSMAITQKDQHAVDFDTSWYDDTDGTDACSGAGAITLTGDTNALKAFNFFVANGISKPGAAGILGSLQAESSVLPQRLEGTPPTTITPAESLTAAQLQSGWGIAQWTPASKMITPIKAAGKDPNDLSVQLQFLLDSLKGQITSDLNAATTPEQAADVFLIEYERPKHPEDTRAFREITARAIYNQATAGGTLPGPVTPPAGLSDTGCSPTSGGSIGGYKDPFRDLIDSHVSRDDGGVDWSGQSGHGPVYAVGPATITRVLYNTHSGWPGFYTSGNGTYITMHMTDGKAKGQYIYLAEDCTPTVSEGQNVTADTVICNFKYSGYGLEIGWGDENGAEEYISWSDYPGHNGSSYASTSGLDMSRFLVAIGSKPGTNTGTQTPLSPPTTWPKW